MKNIIKLILHKLLGFDNYLFTFAVFKVYTLKWDRQENDFFHFMKQIAPGTTILDIGANIGVMTVHLAKKMRSADVLAFEPVPHNIKALKRVVRFFHLKNVRIIETALGNTDGEIEMVMPVVNSVRMQGLSHVVHESISENNEGERFRIKIIRLDGLSEVMNARKKISAIKMDVENFEFFVLEGARELILKFRPIIYTELWENENRKNCFSLMKNMQYRIQVFENGMPVDFIPGKHQTQNFVFVPEKH